MNNGPNRIDPTPLRMSTNVSIDRQTPKADFGDRLKAGLTATAGVVAGGAAIVSPLVPGAGIVSAAVSGMGSLTNGSSTNSLSTSLNAGVGASYAGIGGLGGMGIQTTVGSTTGTTTGGTGVGGIQAGVNGMPIQQANVGGFGQDAVSEMAQESGALLKLQFQMQQETQMFQTISNVLKTRHDTAKNSIGNIH